MISSPYLIFGAIFWSSIGDTLGLSNRLKVVVGIEDVEKFHLDVRKYEKRERDHQNLMASLILRRKYKPAGDPSSENLTANAKAYICAQILRSGVYSSMGLERPEIPNPNFASNVVGAIRYRSQTFTLHTSSKQFEEIVFPCYATDARTRQQGTFYISREFDVNIDFPAVSMGRFVFVKGKHEWLTVVDVAEEAADLVEDAPDRLTLLYAQSRAEDSEVAKNIAENNLCQLDSNQRHQVCSSVLNSLYFEDIVKHYMPGESEKKSCIDPAEGDSWLLEADGHLKEDTPLNEPVIVCVAKLFDGPSTFYLVTRGNEPDNVFVYAPTSGHKIRLLILSKHIRNVFEWKLPVSESTKSTNLEETGASADESTE